MKTKLAQALLVACITLGGAISLFPQPEEALAATPQVYVQNIKFDKAQYAPGDVVNGTFDVFNADVNDVPSFIYTVSLVGGYEGGEPTDVYDTKLFPAVYLTAMEGKSLSFSYTIPMSAGGEGYGIEVIGKLASGLPVGSASEYIAISGENKALSIAAAALKIGNEFYSLESGMTIQEGETPIVAIDLKNTTKAAVSVTPVIAYYDRAVSDTSLATERGTTTISIAAGGSTSISYPLNTFGRKPGVYVATYSLVDADGINRIPAITVRYIVSGDIAKIHSVVLSTKDVMQNGSFDATVEYSGRPVDLRNFEASYEMGNGTLAIKVFNEKNELIATSEEEVELSGVKNKTFALTASTAAKAMRVEATVSKNGTVLDTYAEELAPNFQALADESMQAARMDSVKVILVTVLGILAVLAALVLIIRKIRQSRQQAPTFMQ